MVIANAAQVYPDHASRFAGVRALSVAIAARLSDADATVQSMPDASPAKWHLAHTTWFLETFVLRDHVAGYRPVDERWAFLFNSYYDAEGPRHMRAARGLLTRPSLAEVLDYRARVDAALVAALPGLDWPALELVELGCRHEEQHAELLITDVAHMFAQNPLEPALYPPLPRPTSAPPPPLSWIEGREGVAEIGHAGTSFAFDCEGPRHKVWLTAHALADRTVTNGEWRDFIDDGGYRDARHWLSEGWAWAEREAIVAPLYWRHDERGWTGFGLDGRRALDPHAPVAHVSFYEADAYARWAGARLPTEGEWEALAWRHDANAGNQLDGAGAVVPVAPAHGPDFFGNVWEWTGSPFRPYPGFVPAEGAVGEYNGKFMSGQYVLRGGSCATPRGHAGATYRNFFAAHQRWQFTGVRLARDL